MKPSFTIVFLCFVFFLAACEKSDEEPDNPQWVKEWIEEIDAEEFCNLCEIHRYEFEGDFFYEIYSPIFSCMPCQVHFADGEDVDWEDFSQQEYLNKRKNKVVIYRKAD